MASTIEQYIPGGERPQQAAEEAGLRYASLERPGITRERAGDDWRYRRPGGEIIRDEHVLARIRSIVIPPAWTDVWICTDPRGHIQATGFDQRGRKQYRYHPKWRLHRDETKFDRLAEFGAALPHIRDHVETDLLRPGFPREKVLAIVVKLLDVSLIRIGNKGYERTNGSYGLTTLRNRHVKINGAAIHFTFRGKGGIEQTVDLRDRRLANTIKRMRDLPGYHLFQYIDDDGQRRDISSEDINAYLRAISGEQFTAKDFRTWAGTVRFIEVLGKDLDWETESEAKHRIVQVVNAVASDLGNTPAVCRGSYIHPAAIDAYLDGTSLKDLRKRVRRRNSRPVEELIVLELLRR